MMAPNVIVMTTDEMEQMRTLLQSILRKAEHRDDVESVDLAQRCMKLIEDALD